jgi:hypothetical protein
MLKREVSIRQVKTHVEPEAHVKRPHFPNPFEETAQRVLPTSTGTRDSAFAMRTLPHGLGAQRLAARCLTLAHCRKGLKQGRGPSQYSVYSHSPPGLERNSLPLR